MKEKSITKKHWGVGNPAWRNVNYVKIYQMSRLQFSFARMAKRLGVSGVAFMKWRKKDPAVRHAIREGQLCYIENKDTTFRNYVYQRLPTHLQILWQKINRCESSMHAGDRIDALFAKKGVHARMHIWLYAFVHYNFNKSAACRSVNISNDTFNNWLKTKDFKELLAAMQECKQDMFEEALVTLVRSGEPSAVIFANKTMNKGRGYNSDQKIVHEITGKVEHEHTGEIGMKIDLAELDLPFEVLSTIKEALQRKKTMEKEEPILVHKIGAEVDENEFVQIQ